MRRVAAVVGAAFLVMALAGPVAAAPAGDTVHYYLSLGDSLAAGQQPIGDPTDMYRTRDGYADQLYRMAKESDPKLRHIKLGCPGETTTSFIEGGICAYEHGSQLATALEFLHARGDRVAFVTIDIGWNDVNPTVACILQGLGTPEQCLQPGVDSITSNLPTILGALKAAAPGVPIIGMNMYDPFLAYSLAGDAGQQLADLSLGLLLGVNGLVEAIYGALQVPVADVESAFNTTDSSLVPGVGMPLNVYTICGFTWICSPYQDVHANHDGYEAIADAFAEQLGW
jgi:lysophospholipase L1-like esterase